MATVRQKLAFKKVIKGKSISGAMREVGYSPTTSVVTTKLTKSKGWQELIDKYISEEKLAKVHSEGLNATKKEGDEEVADYAVRHKYLETGYKVRGKLRNDDGGGNTYNFNFLSVEQQQRIARRLQTGDSAGAGEPDRLPDSDES